MKTLITVVLCLVYVTLNAQADNIKGMWLTEEKDAKIKIFKATNGKYYGKIVWRKDGPDKLDDKNPDPAKRNQKIVGLMLMKSFVFNSESNRWDSGTIYDPESGKTYSCYLWFEEDKNKLNLRGYVLGMKMLGRTSMWTRLEE